MNCAEKFCFGLGISAEWVLLYGTVKPISVLPPAFGRHSAEAYCSKKKKKRKPDRLSLSLSLSLTNGRNRSTIQHHRPAFSRLDLNGKLDRRHKPSRLVPVSPTLELPITGKVERQLRRRRLLRRTTYGLQPRPILVGIFFPSCAESIWVVSFYDRRRLVADRVLGSVRVSGFRPDWLCFCFCCCWISCRDGRGGENGTGFSRIHAATRGGA